MKVTDEMVNRFLRWPLPQSVASDLCVTDRSYKFPRSGTSLLGPDEARAMLNFVLGDCPHGMPLAENICGPCSKGEPNRA